MEYSVIYTKNKHWYAQIKDWKIILKIPTKLKNNKEFEYSLAKKAKQLKKAKRNPIQRTDWEFVFLFGEKVLINEILTGRKKNLDKELKNIFLEYSQEIVEEYSQKLWYKYKTISARRLKSKRGSCSSDQKIVLNLDLIHLSNQLIQYVIIHEVCHLKHKHHQQSFWNEVEKYCPNYKEIRKELRNISLS